MLKIKIQTETSFKKKENKRKTSFQGESPRKNTQNVELSDECEPDLIHRYPVSSSSLAGSFLIRWR